MPLCALVLLDAIYQNLEAATNAAVIEVEAEAANLQRLAAAFVLGKNSRGSNRLPTDTFCQRFYNLQIKRFRI